MKTSRLCGLLTILLATFLLTGCGLPVDIQSKYHPEEHRIEEGPNEIIGMVFLKTGSLQDPNMIIMDLLGVERIHDVNSIDQLQNIVKDPEDVILCSGEQVELIAVTDYSEERMEGIYGDDSEGWWHRDSPTTMIGGFNFNPDPESFHELKRTTECGSNGEFHFENIEDGEYFVQGKVTEFFDPKTPAPGTYLMERIDVSGGETEFVILSSRYFL